MGSRAYQYETSPRKLNTEYDYNKTKKVVTKKTSQKKNTKKLLLTAKIIEINAKKRLSNLLKD